MLNELAKEIHENAKDHGWWLDGDRNLGEVLMLCTCELAEAMEEYRDGKPMYYDHCSLCHYANSQLCAPCKLAHKPEGIATEMIDCVIRILDYLAQQDVDADTIMELKNAYNATRPYRHGGKKA